MKIGIGKIFKYDAHLSCGNQSLGLRTKSKDCTIVHKYQSNYNNKYFDLYADKRIEKAFNFKEMF
jgi:hypothetical protein